MVTHATVIDRAVLRETDPALELQLVETRFDTGTHETYQLLARRRSSTRSAIRARCASSST